MRRGGGGDVRRGGRGGVRGGGEVRRGRKCEKEGEEGGEGEGFVIVH